MKVISSPVRDHSTANPGFVLIAVVMTYYDISGDDNRKREAPAAEHPITDCAIV